MRNATKIATDLEVDDPLIQDAEYEFDEDDRQKIDNQILALEQHLFDSLIRGRLAQWFLLDGSSASVAAGDVVCMASVSGSVVTKAVSAALVLAAAATGVVVRDAAAGGFVLVATGGVIPSSITGLATGSPGYVKVNTATARPTRVASLNAADYGIGFVDNAGNMQVGVIVPATPADVASAISALQAYATANPTPLALNANFTCTTSASGGPTNLSLAVAINEVWEIEFEGTVACSGTGGVKFALVGPTGATLEGDIQGEGATNINTDANVRMMDAATYFGTFAAVANVPEPVRGFATITIDGTHSGTVIVSARPVTNGQTATLEAGFKMTCRKVTKV